MATKLKLTVTFTVKIEVADDRWLAGAVRDGLLLFLSEPDIAMGMARGMPTFYDIDSTRVSVEQAYVNEYFDAKGNKVELS